MSGRVKKEKGSAPQQFEARLADASKLKHIVDAVKDLVTEANLECTSDNVALQAMDTSHVSLVCVMLRGDGFAAYRCDRPVSLGVSMSSVAKVLKCSAKDDSLTLGYSGNADTLTFRFSNEGMERSAEFVLKLMDIQADSLGIPESDYKSVCTMPSAEFKRIINDIKDIGESISISISKKGITFAATGDIGSGCVTLGAAGAADGAAVTVAHSGSAPLTQNFAVKYLTTFTKATGLSNTVTLKLSREFPLLVEYALADDLGHVRYYLAPKIDDGAAGGGDGDGAAAAPAAPAGGEEEDAMDD